MSRPVSYGRDPLIESLLSDDLDDDDLDLDDEETPDSVFSDDLDDGDSEETSALLRTGKKRELG